MESDTLQMFLDPRIPQNQYLDKLQIHIRTQTATQTDTLNRFKQAFNQLSGKEVNQHTFDQIEKFKKFLDDAYKMLQKLKSSVERAMTNKVESDNQRSKLLQSLTQVEDFLATDLGNTQLKTRAQQKVLERYQEVACTNDAHWRAFETVDDFIIDQLSDCLAFFDVFQEQEKMRQKCLQLKLTLDQKTENYSQVEKRGNAGVQRARQAKIEVDQSEVAHMEANLTYNITIINLVYESVKQFKETRRLSFANMLKTVCQSKIVQQNELHGYFKFVGNFYSTTA
jgi:predicted CopG family antitoxin